MTIRRLEHVAVFLAALVTPLAAVAQAPNGSVTTTPLAPAPAMGMPVLLLSALVLTGAAAYLLRRRTGRGIAVLGVVAALTALVSLGYATTMLTTLAIDGAQCGMTTTQMFNPMGATTLVSNCPNLIQIVSIRFPVSCMLANSADPCRVGSILTDNQSCNLPGCAVD